MTADSRYKAFISYSHADVGWAKWVQRRLERYRLPANLAKTRGLPRRALYPVFRDEDELAVSVDLSEEIREGLAQSENLIVVCSPSAAASRWVNEEIKAFQSLGRGQRVFSLIVDGDPESDSSNCFPAQLLTSLSSEPLAADVRPGKDRKLALIKLIAALLDLRFDELRRRDTQQRRRDRIVRASTAVASATILVGATVMISTTPPCQGAEDRLVGVWDDTIKREAESAFIAANVSFGPGSLRRSLENLDRYAQSWIETHRDACEATRVRDEQSETLLDLRMACLESRRLDLAAVSGLLRTADANLIERSVDLTRELRGLSQCSDREALVAAYPLPEDPIIQAHIEELRARLAPIRADVSAKHGDRLIDDVSMIVEEAGTLAYPPLAAEALMLLGESQTTAGLVADAESSFYEAASAATRAGDDRMLVRAWLEIISLQVDYRGRLEEAERLLDMADAQLSRIDGAADLEAAVASAHGHVLIRRHSFAAAREAFEWAVEIAERAELVDRGIYGENLVAVLVDLRELDPAETMMQALYADIVSEFGRAHPRSADALWSMARIAQRRSDYAESKALSRESITVFEAAYGTDHPMLASRYQGLAWDLKSLGEFDAAHVALDKSQSIASARPDDVEFFVRAAVQNTRGDLYVSQDMDASAREAFETAVDLWESEQPGHSGVAVPLTNLGSLENRQGRHDRAVAACGRALALDEVSSGTDHPNLGWSLVCIADGQIGSGAVRDASATLDRAQEILDHDNADRHLRAESRFLRALVLWSRAEQSQARRLAVEARDGLTDADPSFGYRRKQIDDWLEAHQQP